MKNKSPIAWNGNSLPWKDLYGYLAFALLLIFLLSFVFSKKLLAQYFTKQKVFGINQPLFWRLLGVVMLVWYGIRQIFYFGSGYPLYWEALSLHICRIHYVLIAVMLIANKTKWMKNIMPVSVMGAIFGIWFGEFSNDFINHHSEIKNVDWKTLSPEQVRLTWSEYALQHGYEPRIDTIDYVAAKTGINYYSVGPDNFQFWDFYIAHFAISVIPLIVFCAKQEKFEFDDVIRSLFFYTPVMVLLWVLNTSTKDAPYAWRMNNWYMAPNSSNPHYDAIGWGSMWPQNLFVYWFIGSLVVMIFPVLWIIQSKIKFFQNGKIISIDRNNKWSVYWESVKNNMIVKFYRHHFVKSANKN